MKRRKFRTITNRDKTAFRIEEEVGLPFFKFWRLFTYGTNEGGGAYYIEKPTRSQAIEELDKEMTKQWKDSCPWAVDQIVEYR